MVARSADEARQASMPAYQRPIVPSPSTVSNTAVSGSQGYQSAGTVVNEDAVILYQMSEPERKELAQALKNAGYRVSVSGKYSSKLLEAYSNASMASALQNQNLPNNQITVRQYLDQETAARIAAGDGTGSGGPKVRKDIRISDETTARTLINAVLQDALGRGATNQELKKYTSALQKAQQAAPVVTTYSTVGDVTSAATTGGINEEQFLIQQIAGTDEAKANKVFGYYDAFKNALGVR
jgi:hypothetical protein